MTKARGFTALLVTAELFELVTLLDVLTTALSILEAENPTFNLFPLGVEVKERPRLRPTFSAQSILLLAKFPTVFIC